MRDKEHGRSNGAASLRLLGVLLITLAAVTSVAVSAGVESDEAHTQNEGSTIFEQFKKFIEKQPPIEDVIFSYVGPDTSRFDLVANRWIQERDKISYFRAKWQPGYLLVAKTDSAKDYDFDLPTQPFELHRGSAMMQHGEGFWSFVSQEQKVTYWHGRLTHPMDLTNPVLLDYHHATLPLFALLNMGPHFVPPHAIRWTQNRFKYAAKVFRDADLIISGELFQDGKGFPEKMAISYQGPSVDGRYVVRYFFGTNTPALPPFIPERVLSVVLNGKDEAADKDLRIRSLKLLTHPQEALGSEQLDHWIVQSRLMRCVFTNKQLYSIGSNGVARLIPRQRLSQDPPIVLAHANRYYYVSSGLLLSGFLILNWRMREQNSKQKTN